MIKGFSDQLEFNSAVMGAAMGGLETSVAAQFAQGTSNLVRKSIVPNVAGDVETGEISVFRVFGGDARAQGFSWTTVDPTSINDFRNLAGLPSGGTSGAINTADFMIK